MIIQLIGKKGSDSVLIEKTATTNDIYRASDFNADGFDIFTVAVPNGTETKTITSNGIYTPTAPNIGFSSVTVNIPEPSGTVSITTNGLKDVKNYEYADINVPAPSPVINPLVVTPSMSSQSIVAPSGVNGFSPITVSAVTADIDANIVAGNIKDGVSILGVAGSVVELNGDTLAITPSTSSQSFTPTGGHNGYTEVTVSAVDSTIDANIVAGNIKDGVTILGVTGSYQGATPSLAIQKVKNANGKVVNGTNIIDLGDATDLGACVLAYEHYGVVFPANTSIDFSSLTTISGYQAMMSCFHATSGVTTVDFSSVVEITGNAALQSCFSSSDIPSITFPSLSRLTGSAVFAYCFSYSSITTISFPALKSTSFGSNTNQFRDMLSGVTGCTVHFPSNLQSVIGSWSDVTNGFGGTNTTVLFDLPETE